MNTLSTKPVAAIADKVSSRDELTALIGALRTDLRDNPDAWENPTLDGYLEALAAWLDDCDGYYRRTGNTPPIAPSWKLLADALVAAKSYE